MRHYVELGLIGMFLAISVYSAHLGLWQPAQYFLFLAAFIDFDDWSHKK